MALQLNNEIIDICRMLSFEFTKMPVNNVWVDYDKKADVLYLSFRKPQNAKETIETDDDILIRTDGDDIVGLTILNAGSRNIN